MRLICSKPQTRNFRSWISHFLPAVLVLISCLFAGGGLSGAAAEPEAVNPAWYTGTIWHQLDEGWVSRLWPLLRPVWLLRGGLFTDAGVSRMLITWHAGMVVPWHAVAPGINGTVRTIAVNGSDIYIGGQFTEINTDTDMNHIAFWDGIQWNSLGSGLDGIVYDMVFSGGNLYVGGSFTGIDPATNDNNIAVWNAIGGWTSIGGDLDNTVQALATYSGQLFVGGNFLDNSSGLGHRVRRYQLVHPHGTRWVVDYPM